MRSRPRLRVPYRSDFFKESLIAPRPTRLWPPSSAHALDPSALGLRCDSRRRIRPAPMKIFTDTSLPPAALELLRSGVAPHELIFSSRPTTSVLGQGTPDPALAEAEFAFGQPDAATVLASPKLQWVHLSSAGYTRYDTAEFRTAALQRGLVLTNSSSVYAEACALHALAYILAQARCLPRALRTRTASGTEEWNELRNASAVLRGQRVLMFGYGAIASRLAL